MLSVIEQVLLFIMVFCLMVGIGCSLELSDVKLVAKEKKAILTGLFLQYVSMPLIAYTILSFTDFSPLARYTILLIACCPGGSTSNMFTFFSKGDVSLSLFLTTLTTLFAFFMTPTLLSTFGKMEAISIPYKNIASTLLFTLVPVVIGFVVRMKSVKLALMIEKVGTKIGHLAILIMIGIWFPKVFEVLKNQDRVIFLSLLSMCFFAVSISFLVGMLTCKEGRIAKTLSFETGIQNAPLAFAIITLSFPKETALEVSWIPLVYGAISVGVAIVFTTFYAKILKEKL
jgi:BASS family bile acid:Na+ symporter